MTDIQNQFYSSISKYYSEIFPYNPLQLNFVKDKVVELNKKDILDIGCATGELAVRLAEHGVNVTGIDLNDDLLNQASLKYIKPNLKFQYGNMLELQSDFEPDQFDAVLCFGNTLVHLESTKLVAQMLKAANAVLKSGGQLLIQLLNYDYILDQQVSALPLIETENIRFIRKYKFYENSNSILFQTELDIVSEQKTVSNETPLLALKSGSLIQLLEMAGFYNIKLYSNFKQDVFGGKHFPLIVSCSKR